MVVSHFAQKIENLQQPECTRCIEPLTNQARMSVWDDPGIRLNIFKKQVACTD